MTICIKLTCKTKNILLKMAYNTLGNNKHKIHLSVRTHVQPHVNVRAVETNSGMQNSNNFVRNKIIQLLRNIINILLFKL